MFINLDKKELIELIKSIPIPMGGIEGLTKFCGNQWNEDWCWSIDGIESLSEEEIYNLYCILKERK